MNPEKKHNFGRESRSELGKFKVGKNVRWKDVSASTLFNKPAYGNLGEGPFEILDIIVSPTWDSLSQSKPDNPPKFGNLVLLVIKTQSGVTKELSADYFEPAN